MLFTGLPFFVRRLPRQAGLAGVLLLSVAACSPDRPGVRVPSGTPIVLISVDTLRADRLPAYGYDRIETPAFDALRRDSVLFAHAYSPVPLTLPAHSTVMTGLLPAEHEVRDNMGYRLDSESLPSLPRELKALGYRTGAAVSSFVLRGSSGLAHGFDHFDDTIESRAWAALDIVQRPGGETAERALDWLRSVGSDPFFLFFHIYEPHTPHEPPEPYASLYESPYDGDVAAADAVIGQFLDGLRELGLYDRSIIFLTSDHGEGLNDHGEYEHGPLLYREVLQIPMMLKLPSAQRGGTTAESAAQLPDIFPTVMALLGKDVPPGLPGASLLELEPPGGPPRQRPILGETLYPRLHFGWSELFSVIRYPFHFIDGPDPELYDLASDGKEQRNILRERREILNELRTALESYDREIPAPGEVDPATREKLAALGYIGGGFQSATGELKDPKSRMGVLALMREAIAHSDAGDPGAAAAGFRQILVEEPGMVDAWVRLGDALTQLGEYEEAVVAYERGLELSGGAAQVAVSAASGYLKLGRLEEARERAELAVNVHELARDLLGEILLRQGELAQAERQLQLAVERRGARTAPLVTQAKLRLAQERFHEAIDLTVAAERELAARGRDDGLPGLYFTRGRAYALLGEARSAVEAFLREIDLFPSELAPYTHLAFLYALEGDAARAGGTLRRMVETNNHPHAYAEAVRTLRAMGDPRSAGAVLETARRSWPESAELQAL